MSTMSAILSHLAQHVEDHGYGFIQLPPKYASRYRQGYERLRTEMAIASISILPQDDPLFAKGILINHQATIVEDPLHQQTGLEVTKRDTEQPTAPILILEVAINGTEITTTRFTYSGLTKAHERLSVRGDLPDPIIDALQWIDLEKLEDNAVRIAKKSPPRILTSKPTSTIV